MLHDPVYLTHYNCSTDSGWCIEYACDFSPPCYTVHPVHLTRYNCSTDSGWCIEYACDFSPPCYTVHPVHLALCNCSTDSGWRIEYACDFSSNSGRSIECAWYFSSDSGWRFECTRCINLSRGIPSNDSGWCSQYAYYLSSGGGWCVECTCKCYQSLNDTITVIKILCDVHVHVLWSRQGWQNNYSLKILQRQTRDLMQSQSFASWGCWSTIWLRPNHLGTCKMLLSV